MYHRARRDGMDRDRRGRLEHVDRRRWHPHRRRASERSTTRGAAAVVCRRLTLGTHRQGADRMIWVVLPAFNEEASLLKLLQQLDATMQKHGSDYRLLVVDDGSRDATAEILARLRSALPLDVITHP